MAESRLFFKSKQVKRQHNVITFAFWSEVFVKTGNKRWAGTVTKWRRKTSYSVGQNGSETVFKSKTNGTLLSTLERLSKANGMLYWTRTMLSGSILCIFYFSFYFFIGPRYIILLLSPTNNHHYIPTYTYPTLLFTRIQWCTLRINFLLETFQIYFFFPVPALLQLSWEVNMRRMREWNWLFTFFRGVDSAP